MVLRARHGRPVERPVHVHRHRHADRQPGVEQAQRRGPAATPELQRADAEQWRREKRPGEVVDAERRPRPSRAPRPRPSRRPRPRRRAARRPTRCGRRAGARPASLSEIRGSGKERSTSTAVVWRSASGSAGAVVNLSDLEKRYLFTPGPTPVPPQVLAAGAEPIVHHRGVDFREIYASTLDRLKGVYRTESDVLLFTASGSGAMESVVANLCEPGDRVAVVSHGSFGERWVAICEQHGVEVQAIRYEWGEVPDADEIGAAVRESGVDLVLCQQSDTSTGVVSDVRAVKEAVGDATLVVDAISSLGAVPLETDGVGDRRRRLGLAEGSDVPARPRDGLSAGAGARACEAVPQLLLRLARQQEGAGQARRGVHAGRVADPQPRRRARPDPRRRPRRCVRAPHPARPRRARRHQGDGPRALLARRRHARPW